MKIDVGCGNKPKKGFIGVDMYIKKKSNVRANALNLPFMSNSIDELYCSHMIEHLPNNKIDILLNEFYRVFKTKLLF